VRGAHEPGKNKGPGKEEGVKIEGGQQLGERRGAWGEKKL